MGVILKLALRNMKRRKVRYILTTITLVIGVALFGGILIASDSFDVMFKRDIDRRMGTADILIRESEDSDGWFRPSDLKDIEKIDGVEDVSYRIAGFDVYTTSIPDGTQRDNSTKTAVYGIDIESKDEAKLGGNLYTLDSKVDGDTIEELLEEGKKEYGNKAVIITEALKIKLGNDFEAGDSLRVLPIDYYLVLGKDETYKDTLSSNTGLWPEYKVVAIIRDLGEARDFDPETPDEFSTPSQGACIFADIDTAHELVDGIVNHDGYYTLAAIGVDDINNVEIIIDEIEDELDKDKWSVADLKTESLEDINQSTEMMNTMFLMFALIALILAIILIMNIFNIIKEEQEYETGMLQAVGASKRETFKMFLTQGVVMAIIGTVIGTICSYFMSYAIFAITVQSLQNMPGEFGENFANMEWEIVLLPQTIIITLLVGLLSCILAAIYPSWKASRKPLIECLNPLAHKTERERKHHLRKFGYLALGILLLIYGNYLLFGGGMIRGRHTTMNEATVAFLAPTLILLGIIGILAIFVGPITSGFIQLFGKYLKQTKLLTKKNVLRHRKRTVLTFAMISLTTSYLIGISVLMGSFREGIHTTVTDVMGCDIRVFAAGTSRSFEELLEDIDGVDDAMGVSHGNVQLWDDDEWVGHGLLDKEWDSAVSVQIFEPKEVERHMTNTVILSPSDMTLEKMMDKISKQNTMIITNQEADDFNLEVGDKIPVKFSLGITYATLDDFFAGNDDTAQENTVIVELKVVAIVEKFQGFATGEIIGQEGNVYNIFISWETYEAVARENLPGGNTDLISRQITQTGDLEFDAAQTRWFNSTYIPAIMDGFSGIDYYTTRMDYFSPTFAYDEIFNITKPQINYLSSVVGIRTNSSGNLKDDSYFGNSKIISPSGKTLEQLLNTTSKNVCVVDESYITYMKKFNQSFGIGSNISIFPHEFKPTPDPLPVGSFNTKVTTANGTVISGTEDDLTMPMPFSGYMTIVSNLTSLEIIIDVNMTTFHYLKPYNVNIVSFVNATIKSLELEVYNFYADSYERLGTINSTIETTPYSFDFDQEVPPFTYTNQSNNILRLRIKGDNNTYDSDYELNIDNLYFLVRNSTKTLNASTWPYFEIVGIIKNPTLYQTERYAWLAGYETGYDVSQTKNSVYINYKNAREQVYIDYASTINETYDKITHVLVHCNNIDEISSIRNQLFVQLNMTYGPLPTIIDLKTDTLEYRTYAFDWYIWIEEGYYDEDVLTDITEYMEEHGYVVLFAFTNSYITTIFESMIDLITMIMNGILVFAIIISMIGLALHCLLSTMARRREIGMLRSIGLNKKGVVRTISGETLVIALMGTIIGIFAGLLTGYLMVASIPSTGFLTVTLSIPWLTIGILILVTLATAIFSSRYPSKWAANINIIDAVRTR